MKKKIVLLMFSFVVLGMTACGENKTQTEKETLVEGVPSPEESEEDHGYYIDGLDLSVEEEPTIENPVIENEYVVIGDYTRLIIEKIKVEEPTQEEIQKEFDAYMGIYPKEEEITDEFVAENTEYPSIQAYKDAIRKQLQSAYEAQAESVRENEMWKKLQEIVAVKKYEEDVVKDYVLEYINSMEEQISQTYKMTLNASLKQQKISKKEFRVQAQTMAKSQDKQKLCLEAIQKQEGLETTEDVIDFLKEHIVEE